MWSLFRSCWLRCSSHPTLFGPHTTFLPPVGLVSSCYTFALLVKKLPLCPVIGWLLDYYTFIRALWHWIVIVTCLVVDWLTTFIVRVPCYWYYCAYLYLLLSHLRTPQPAPHTLSFTSPATPLYCRLLTHLLCLLPRTATYAYPKTRCVWCRCCGRSQIFTRYPVVVVVGLDYCGYCCSVRITSTHLLCPS